MKVRQSALCCSLLVACAFAASADELPKTIPPPAIDNPLRAGAPQSAVLAGGCYWGMQEMLEHVKGVQSVVAGMTGFQTLGDSIIARDHDPAEAVEVTFDPGQISYGQLLQIYFSVAHDPTQVDRQGPDHGSRYRSEILYNDDAQKKIAESYIEQLQQAGAFGEPIATHVDSLQIFHRVPEGQQDYAIKHPTLPYIVAVDLPRLAAFERLYPGYFVKTPVTTP